ncbi:hypothetical protein ACM64Y_06475 [Novispirillum sp. DQ9]|uniref:hypothetical protein n=1 Tax=Novispirillum sp. DQ9 TaxID=3398612 RepID=UPI003C7C9AD6
MKKFCFVSGVHRSGTSTTAAMIAYCGYSVGKASVRHSAKDNSRGYYETLDVVRTNDAMAREIGLRWDSLIASPEVFRAVHGAWYGRIKDAVRSNFDHVDRAVLKDPRFAVHLKVWRDAVADLYPDAALMDVYVLRSPAEVIASLVKRNARGGVTFAHGMDPAMGALFWIFQTIGFLKGLAGRPVLLVDYARQNTAQDRRDLFSRIGETLGETLSDDACAAFEREFFHDAERDGGQSAAPGSHPYQVDAQALYDMLRSGETVEAVLTSDLGARYSLLQSTMGAVFNAECRPVLSRFAEIKTEYERGLAIARVGDFLFNRLTMDQLASVYEDRCRLTGEGLQGIATGGG